MYFNVSYTSHFSQHVCNTFNESPVLLFRELYAELLISWSRFLIWLVQGNASMNWPWLMDEIYQTLYYDICMYVHKFKFFALPRGISGFIYFQKTRSIRHCYIQGPANSPGVVFVSTYDFITTK